MRGKKRGRMMRRGREEAKKMVLALEWSNCRK